MKIQRPLFLVREDTNVDVAISAAMPLISADCHPLILVQPARANNWRVKYILDAWDCVDEELEAVRVKGQQIVQAFAARRVVCEMQILHQDEPWRVRSIASRHNADMLITSRFPKARPNRHHTALAEADLARSLDIPVCFVGSGYIHDRPVVGMLDLTRASDGVTQNNRAVIQSTFAMAVQNDAISRVVFMSYSPEDDRPSAWSNRKSMLEEIVENQKTATKPMSKDAAVRERHSALCSSMDFEICDGSENEFREQLIALDPTTIVMGCPVRSALARCFNPGMTAVLLGMDRTVVMTRDKFKNQDSASELPAQRPGRRLGGTGAMKNAPTSVS